MNSAAHHLHVNTGTAAEDLARPVAANALRILLPIGPDADARWSVRYALRKHAEGRRVEVILLNVGERVRDWEALRFRTRQEIDQFQIERAQFLLDAVAPPLQEADIPCRAYFRQGELVFTILDTAEELACDEIVMPYPRRGFMSLFSRGVVHATLRRQRHIPVVLVSKEGAEKPG